MRGVGTCFLLCGFAKKNSFSPSSSTKHHQASRPRSVPLLIPLSTYIAAPTPFSCTSSPAAVSGSRDILQIPKSVGMHLQVG
jgi:hypothetical protein